MLRKSLPPELVKLWDVTVPQKHEQVVQRTPLELVELTVGVTVPHNLVKRTEHNLVPQLIEKITEIAQITLLEGVEQIVRVSVPQLPEEVVNASQISPQALVEQTVDATAPHPREKIREVAQSQHHGISCRIAP